MLAALLIVFRESIEAGLIIGIALAATRGVAGRGFWVLGGVGAGFVGSVVLAACTGFLAGAFSGVGLDIFNASILFVAVFMLGWHIVWMARHGRETAGALKAAGEAAQSGRSSLLSLALVIALAVLREGAEVVLFLFGVFTTEEVGAAPVAAGALAGLALGGVLSALTFFGLAKIPMRHFFKITNALIAFLAAGMAAQAVGFLEQAGVIVWLDRIMWDSSGVLPESSALGRILHTMIGYSDRPSQMQFVVYVSVLLVLALSVRFAGSNPASPIQPYPHNKKRAF